MYISIFPCVLLIRMPWATLMKDHYTHSSHLFLYQPLNELNKCNHHFFLSDKHNSNHPRYDLFHVPPFFLLLSFSPECLYLFLSSKNRAGHFNRRDLVVCLKSPNGCTAPDMKDKRDIVCVFYMCERKSRERGKLRRQNYILKTWY